MQNQRKYSEKYAKSKFLTRTEPGQADLEQKFSADEREVYGGAPVEETERKQKQ